jgi:hypothetical protein
MRPGCGKSWQAAGLPGRKAAPWRSRAPLLPQPGAATVDDSRARAARFGGAPRGRTRWPGQAGPKDRCFASSMASILSGGERARSRRATSRLASGAPARAQPRRALRRARRQSHRRGASAPHHGPRRRTVVSARSPESSGGRPSSLHASPSVGSHSRWHQSIAASGTRLAVDMGSGQTTTLDSGQITTLDQTAGSAFSLSRSFRNASSRRRCAATFTVGEGGRPMHG